MPYKNGVSKLQIEITSGLFLVYYRARGVIGVTHLTTAEMEVPAIYSYLCMYPAAFELVQVVSNDVIIVRFIDVNKQSNVNILR